MAHSKLKKAVVAAVLVVALGAPMASASDSDNGWWSGMGRMMGQWGRGSGRMMGQGGPGFMSGPMMGLGEDEMLDRIDGRLAFMKTELKITEDQKAAWDDFAEVVRNTAVTRNAMMQSMRKDFESGDFLKMTLPDRLTLQETHMEARLEEVRSVKEAADKLYAVLSDEQKEAADEIVLPTMGMGMGRMGGPRGMRN